MNFSPGNTANKPIRVSDPVNEPRSGVSPDEVQISPNAEVDALRSTPTKDEEAPALAVSTDPDDTTGPTNAYSGNREPSFLYRRIIPLLHPPSSRKMSAAEEVVRLQADLKRRTEQLDIHWLEILRLREQNHQLKKHTKKLMYANDALRQDLKDLKIKQELLDHSPPQPAVNTSGVVKEPSTSARLRDLERKVKELNERIFQVAESVSLTVLHESPHELSKEDLDKFFDFAERTVGLPLAKMLAKEGRKATSKGLKEPKAFLAHAVLQVHLTGLCYNIIDEWVPNPDVSAFLDGLFATIHMQRTSENCDDLHLWRTTTRANIAAALATWSNNWDGDGVLADWRIIFRVVHWQWFKGGVSSTIEKKLDHIVKLAQDIRLSIDQVPSILLRIFTIPPGSLFDPGHMNDAFFGSEETEELRYPKLPLAQCVVATVALGLMKLNQTERTKLLFETVMLPTVLLESDLRRSVFPVESWMCGKSDSESSQ